MNRKKVNKLDLFSSFLATDSSAVVNANVLISKDLKSSKNSKSVKRSFLYILVFSFFISLSFLIFSIFNAKSTSEEAGAAVTAKVGTGTNLETKSNDSIDGHRLSTVSTRVGNFLEIPNAKCGSDFVTCEFVQYGYWGEVAHWGFGVGSMASPIHSWGWMVREEQVQSLEQVQNGLQVTPVAGGGQVQTRDIHRQTSTNQGQLQSGDFSANNFITGVTSDYRTYNPANSKYSSVAATRSSAFDPQRGIANFYGSGRYSNNAHWIANSSQATVENANRLSYLAPSVSRPNAYHWGQDYLYGNTVKAAFTNQFTYGINFYRLSDGNKVVMDQFTNTNHHWFLYNHVNMDNNLLTLSNSGAVSKIETTTTYQDRTDSPTTPLLFQTHGGIPENEITTWRTDYSRDTAWTADDRDTYIIYRPNFGANVQLPADIETLGEWASNSTGGRSGRWRDPSGTPVYYKYREGDILTKKGHYVILSVGKSGGYIVARGSVLDVADANNRPVIAVDEVNDTLYDAPRKVFGPMGGMESGNLGADILEASQYTLNGSMRSTKNNVRLWWKNDQGVDINGTGTTGVDLGGTTAVSYEFFPKGSATGNGIVTLDVNADNGIILGEGDNAEGEYRVKITSARGVATTYVFTIDRTAPKGQLELAGSPGVALPTSGTVRGAGEVDSVRFLWKEANIVGGDDVSSTSAYANAAVTRTNSKVTMSYRVNGGAETIVPYMHQRQDKSGGNLPSYVSDFYFNNPGNYEVFLRDKAGNVSTYEFKIHRREFHSSLIGSSNAYMDQVSMTAAIDADGDGTYETHLPTGSSSGSDVKLTWNSNVSGGFSSVNTASAYCAKDNVQKDCSYILGTNTPAASGSAVIDEDGEYLIGLKNTKGYWIYYSFHVDKRVMTTDTNKKTYVDNLGTIEYGVETGRVVAGHDMEVATNPQVQIDPTHDLSDRKVYTVNFDPANMADTTNAYRGFALKWKEHPFANLKPRIAATYKYNGRDMGAYSPGVFLMSAGVYEITVTDTTGRSFIYEIHNATKGIPPVTIAASVDIYSATDASLLTTLSSDVRVPKAFNASSAVLNIGLNEDENNINTMQENVGTHTTLDGSTTTDLKDIITGFEDLTNEGDTCTFTLEGTYRITLSRYESGNTYTLVLAFTINRTKPTILGAPTANFDHITYWQNQSMGATPTNLGPTGLTAVDALGVAVPIIESWDETPNSTTANKIYTKTYSATDSAGNKSEWKFYVAVVNIDLRNQTSTGNAILDGSYAKSVYVNYNSATSSTDGDFKLGDAEILLNNVGTKIKNIQTSVLAPSDTGYVDGTTYSIKSTAVPATSIISFTIVNTAPVINVTPNGALTTGESSNNNLKIDSVTNNTNGVASATLERKTTLTDQYQEVAGTLANVIAYNFNSNTFGYFRVTATDKAGNTTTLEFLFIGSDKKPTLTLVDANNRNLSVMKSSYSPLPTSSIATSYVDAVGRPYSVTDPANASRLSRTISYYRADTPAVKTDVSSINFLSDHGLAGVYEVNYSFADTLGNRTTATRYIYYSPLKVENIIDANRRDVVDGGTAVVGSVEFVIDSAAAGSSFKVSMQKNSGTATNVSTTQSFTIANSLDTYKFTDDTGYEFTFHTINQPITTSYVSDSNATPIALSNGLILSEKTNLELAIDVLGSFTFIETDSCLEKKGSVLDSSWSKILGGTGIGMDDYLLPNVINSNGIYRLTIVLGLGGSNTYSYQVEFTYLVTPPTFTAKAGVEQNRYFDSGDTFTAPEAPGSIFDKIEDAINNSISINTVTCSVVVGSDPAQENTNCTPALITTSTSVTYRVIDTAGNVGTYTINYLFGSFRLQLVAGGSDLANNAYINTPFKVIKDGDLIVERLSDASGTSVIENVANNQQYPSAAITSSETYYFRRSGDSSSLRTVHVLPSSINVVFSDADLGVTTNQTNVASLTINSMDRVTSELSEMILRKGASKELDLTNGSTVNDLISYSFVPGYQYTINLTDKAGLQKTIAFTYVSATAATSLTINKDAYALRIGESITLPSGSSAGFATDSLGRNISSRIKAYACSSLTDTSCSLESYTYSKSAIEQVKVKYVVSDDYGSTASTYVYIDFVTVVVTDNNGVISSATATSNPPVTVTVNYDSSVDRVNKDIKLAVSFNGANTAETAYTAARAFTAVGNYSIKLDGAAAIFTFSIRVGNPMLFYSSLPNGTARTGVAFDNYFNSGVTAQTTYIESIVHAESELLSKVTILHKDNEVDSFNPFSPVFEKGYLDYMAGAANAAQANQMLLAEIKAMAFSEGFYQITVKDTSSYITTEEFLIISSSAANLPVFDTEPSDMTVAKGWIYEIPEITATDAVGAAITNVSRTLVYPDNSTLALPAGTQDTSSLDLGAHMVTYRAVDRAGNAKIIFINIYVVEVEVVLYGTSNVVGNNSSVSNSGVEINLLGTDCEAATYKINGGADLTGSQVIEVGANGLYEISIGGQVVYTFTLTADAPIINVKSDNSGIESVVSENPADTDCKMEVVKVAGMDIDSSNPSYDVVTTLSGILAYSSYMDGYTYRVTVIDNILNVSSIIEFTYYDQTTIPTLTLSVPDEIILKGSTYTILDGANAGVATSAGGTTGDLSANIICEGTVNTNVVGVYMLRYSVTDGSYKAMKNVYVVVADLKVTTLAGVTVQNNSNINISQTNKLKVQITLPQNLENILPTAVYTELSASMDQFDYGPVGSLNTYTNGATVNISGVGSHEIKYSGVSAFSFNAVNQGRTAPSIHFTTTGGIAVSTADINNRTISIPDLKVIGVTGELGATFSVQLYKNETRDLSINSVADLLAYTFVDGVYTIIVTDNLNISTTVTFAYVLNNPIVSFKDLSSNNIYLTQSGAGSVSDGFVVSWSNPSITSVEVQFNNELTSQTISSGQTYSNAGVYKVTITNNAGKTSVFTITILKAADTIDLLGGETVLLRLGESYSELGARAINKAGNPMAYVITYEKYVGSVGGWQALSSLGTSNPSVGHYKVHYTADTGSGTISVTRTLYVIQIDLAGTNGSDSISNGDVTIDIRQDLGEFDPFPSVSYEFKYVLVRKNGVATAPVMVDLATMDSTAYSAEGRHEFYDATGELVVFFLVDKTAPVLSVNGAQADTIMNTYSITGSNSILLNFVAPTIAETSYEVTMYATNNPSPDFGDLNAFGYVKDFSVTVDTGSLTEYITASGYYVFVAVDEAGNSIQYNFQVYGAGPSITLVGDSNMEIPLNGGYSEPGYTASDSLGVDLTNSVVVTGTIDPAVAGTYTLTYTVTDSLNRNRIVTRTIRVIDVQGWLTNVTMHGGHNFANATGDVTFNTSLASTTARWEFFAADNSTSIPTNSQDPYVFGDPITDLGAGKYVVYHYHAGNLVDFVKYEFIRDSSDPLMSAAFRSIRTGTLLNGDTIIAGGVVLDYVPRASVFAALVKVDVLFNDVASSLSVDYNPNATIGDTRQIYFTTNGRYTVTITSELGTTITKSFTIIDAFHYEVYRVLDNSVEEIVDLTQGNLFSTDVKIKWIAPSVNIELHKDGALVGQFSGNSISISENGSYQAFLVDGLSYSSPIDFVIYRGEPVITVTEVPGYPGRCENDDGVIYFRDRANISVAGKLRSATINGISILAAGSDTITDYTESRANVLLELRVTNIIGVEKTQKLFIDNAGPKIEAPKQINVKLKAHTTLEELISKNVNVTDAGSGVDRYEVDETLSEAKFDPNVEGLYKIGITAYDRVGNSSVIEIEILVAPNAPVNPAAAIAAGGSIFFLISLGYFLVLKKKRKA